MICNQKNDQSIHEIHFLSSFIRLLIESSFTSHLFGSKLKICKRSLIRSRCDRWELRVSLVGNFICIKSIIVLHNLSTIYNYYVTIDHTIESHVWRQTLLVIITCEDLTGRRWVCHLNNDDCLTIIKKAYKEKKTKFVHTFFFIFYHNIDRKQTN